MSVLASLLIGLALGLVIVVVVGAWLWRAWRPRREVFEGRRILAGMRWRELSNLVMDALASAGFEPESRETRAERGTEADLIMHRDGRPWLIACKQGLDHRISPAAVEELQRTVRVQQAAGAVMVTPGHVDPKARLVAANIELADGNELWRLLEPMLPASVLDEVALRARAQAMRHGALVLAAASLAALGTTWALTRFQAADGALAAPTVAERPRVPASPASAPAAPAMVAATEEEQRRELAERLAGLAGIDRALWSTRSTLQLYVSNPRLATDAAICQVVERYPDVRASRLQIQPPPGDERPVRFMQCRAY